jgi:hypothetical protein
MKLEDIFEKDPSRTISRVVMVDQHREEIVSNEVEEYVATEQICQMLQDIIDQFLETRMGRENDVCVWISGFFGSGKSHFAKMLGYILSDRDVVYPDGSRVNVPDYFAKKHGIRGTNILSGVLKTKAFFYNMLKFDRAKDEDLCRYVYRSLLRDLGFSEVPWIAEIEHSLQIEGLWDDFKEIVKKDTKKDWEEIREIEVQMRPALVKALTEIKSDTYPNYEIAQQAVQDQRDEFILGTERLVKRLLEETIQNDEVEGRIVLILDEVGLYLKSAGASGLTELNSLAEDLERIGKGKIWLFATAQEALEAVAPEMGGRRDQIGWLQDRFSLKYSLLPKNIPKVVNRRLLAKDHESEAFRKLQKLFSENSGQLNLAARIENPTHDLEIFSTLDFDEFAISYPLLPYHIDVMIDIFSRLRSKGRIMGQDTRLAGRERAVLSVVQSILLELFKRDSEIGDLVTFDLLFDSIDSVLRIVSTDENNLITERIAQLGELEGLEVSSVAKGLFLLQQINDWIPCTLNNVGAVLYPKIGLRPHEHSERVKQCLELLIEHRWVKEEEGKYRFLSEVERTFEEDVTAQTQLIRTSEIGDRVVEMASDALKGLRSYNHKKLRVFDVLLSIDDSVASRNGYLKLKIFSPFWVFQRDDPVDDVYLESLGKDDTVLWVGREERGFTTKVKRVLAIERVLNDWTKRARTPQQLAELENYRRELETLKDDLPNVLKSSLIRGTVFLYGSREDLDGKEELENIFEKFMMELTEHLFTRFNEGAVSIPRDDVIEAILRWRGGTLPSVYRELKLIDADNKNIITNGPVAHAVLNEVRKRGEVTGAEISEHFDSPPFGWDEKVIRTALAALYKTGSIQASPAENSSFTARRNFRSTVFSVGIAPTKEEKEKARKTLSERFGVDTGVTTEQISETILAEAEKRIKNITNLVSTDGYYRLPYVDEINVLRNAFESIIDQPSPSHRVKEFLAPEVMDPLEKYLDLLDSLDEFVKGDRLNLYLNMREFSGSYLEKLEDQDPSLKADADSFREKLESKNVLAEWGNLYDKFRILRNKHKEEYLNVHNKLQSELEKAEGSIRYWAREKQIENEKIEEALEGWGFLTCNEKDAYDDIIFQCTNCNRNLTELRFHETLIPKRVDDAKKKLLDFIIEVEKPTFKNDFATSITVSKESDFKEQISEASDFVRYWLAKGKNIHLNIQGETKDG